MYIVTKRMEVSAGHKLCLAYDSPCSRLHGHNWIVEVEVSSERLNSEGMVLDFTVIKKEIKSRIDHQYLNDILNANPTAENIAKWIVDILSAALLLLYRKGQVDVTAAVTKVTVQESEGNTACYIP